MRQILGPFSTFWTEFEDQKEAALANPDKSDFHSSMERTGTLFEQTITMIGQVCNTLSYHRRLNVLGAMFQDSKKAKEILREQRPALEEDSPLLFGPIFEEFVSRHLKSKKKTREIVGMLTPKANSVRGKTRPFRGGPLHSRGGGRGQLLYAGHASRTFTSNKQRGHPHPFNSFRGKKSNRFTSFFSIQECSPTVKKSVSNSSNKFKEPPSGREIEVFSRELEGVDFRFRDTESSSGGENTISNTTSSVKKSLPYTYVERGKVGCEPRNKKYGCQGSSKQSESITRPISKLNFYSGQEGGGHRPVVNLKELNSHIPYMHFKLEGLHMVRDLLKKGDLMVKLDLKDAYFSVPLSTQDRKYLLFKWEGDIFEFTCLCFGLSLAPPNFYKSSQNTNFSSKKVECETNNLSGRYTSHGTVFGKHIDSKRLLDFPTSESRISNKCKKIDSNPCNKNRISWNGDKFRDNGAGITQGKSGQNSPSVSKHFSTANCNSSMFIKVERTTVFDSFNSITSPIELSVSSTATDTCSVEAGILSSKSEIGPSCTNRASMGDRESSIEQRSFSYPQIPRPSDKLRCLKNGLGSSLSWPKNWGSLDKEGISLTYKCSGTKGSLPSNKDLHTNEARRSDSCSDGQCSSIDIPSKNGGNSQPRTVESKQGNLEISSGQGDHSYCRIPSRNFEFGGRLGVQKHPRLKRVTTAMGFPKIDFFAFRVSHQIQSYMSWKTDPFSLGRDAFLIKWDKGLMYAFPPFSLIGRVLQKVVRDQTTLILIAPLWQTQGWYSTILQLSVRNPILLPDLKKYSNQFQRPSSSSYNAGIPKVSGMACLRTSLQAEGISEKAAILISSARREGTNAHYESAWRKYAS